MRSRGRGLLLLVSLLWVPLGRASAQGPDDPIEVRATDVLWLAGRTDVEIPAIDGDLTGFPIERTDAGPGQRVETRPLAIAVTPGEELRFDAGARARYAPHPPFPSPDGDELKHIAPVGGISDYVGPGGALAGVFLGDDVPVSGPPAGLDFSPAGLGTAFESLEPGVGQAFFIGDGLTGTGSGVRQRFTVPDGATRLFLGTIDAWTSAGVVLPGLYTDNVGRILVARVGPPIEVLATDAISLAGRDDITIPPLDEDPGDFPLVRFYDPDGHLETFPTSVEVDMAPGESLFFYAYGDAVFTPGGLSPGPDGDVPKFVLPVGGISGYAGRGGSLVAVFLDDETPIDDPPPRLDFSMDGIGIDFRRIGPELGQIFFIGDGTSGEGLRQRFDVPEGATRVLFGTMDAEGAGTTPGFYTDNTGSYFVEFVPEPSGGALALVSTLCLVRLAQERRRRTKM